MKYFQSSRYPIELVLSENIDKEYHTHNHANHWVLTMVIWGNVVVEISGNKKTCWGGDYFIIPPYIPHAMSINKEARILSLCVQKDFLIQHEVNEIKDIVQMYIEELCMRTVISDEYGKRFMDLLGDLYEMKNRTEESSDKDIKEIASLMLCNPETVLTLDELAETVHLNKYQFIKNFKREIGISPHQFHIQSRVRRAQKLLKDKKAILDVSVEMGFYDQSHFNKTFRRIVGVTPIEYVDSYEMLA